MRLTSTVSKFSGGLATLAETLETSVFTFTDTWVAGETFTISLTDTRAGVAYEFGLGDASGQTPTFALTYRDRVLVLAGSTVYFSALTSGVIFNDPNGVGNGNVTLTNHIGLAENLVACAPYQGRMVFLSRNSVQIWDTPADPIAWNMVQTLPNIGTVAALSVQSLGTLDVLFLHDSGVRSLRVRDSSLNAFVEDIGSPIDELIAEKITECTDDELASACSVMEANSNRYWLFLKDTIYVLSYFPNGKIIAWATYTPTYVENDVEVTFTPLKMLWHEGRVYIVTADKLIVFGGDDGVTYDATTAYLELPWLDDGQPTTSKQMTSVDVGVSGAWGLQLSTDLIEERFTPVLNVDSSTFNFRRLGYNGRGTHFKLKAQTSGETAAKLSSIVVHYNPEQQR